MSSAGDRIEGSTAAGDAERDWQAIRDAADIQFAPIQPAKPPEIPGWLEAVSKWLREVLGPIGEALGLSWPVIEVVLIALAAAGVLALAWYFLAPLFGMARRRSAEEEPEWTPDREAAVALLEDADRLAAEGRYGEAAHLLLQRSVFHIRNARPEWLLPASTAREIAMFPMLPERARNAFSAIATRVERSLFALRELDRDDWQAARGAYADFALADLRG